MFEREKTLEALRYFHEKVRKPSHIKLLKLVFYLDLLHLRQTGRSVTGLQYEAWPFGPVPPVLWGEIKDSSADLHRHFDISGAEQVVEPAQDVGGDVKEGRAFWQAGAFVPRAKHQNQYLTRREMNIAAELAEIFCDASADDMSEVSHNVAGPWRLARKAGQQVGNPRPVIDMVAGACGLGRTEVQLPPDVLAEVVSEHLENKVLLQ